MDERDEAAAAIDGARRETEGSSRPWMTIAIVVGIDYRSGIFLLPSR